jgi:D-alanyl-D-alanine carboxypeptidase (penicillin-binding protein 5/6)
MRIRDGFRSSLPFRDVRRQGDDECMRRRAVAGLVVVLLLAAVAAASPLAGTAARGPTARAWIAVDATTGNVLLAQRARERRPIASLTKMMTGLLVAEAGDLGRRVAVPLAATQVEPTNEGLRPGGRYTRLTLLYSAMLVSANDSATALGYDLGGGSLTRFFGLMNARAGQLGMRETWYASPSGLDDVRNSSTAYDQALLARAALRNPTFRHVVATRRYVTRWSAPTLAKEWLNHNKMLFTYPGTYGIKTGWTSRAGGCVAVAVRRGDRAVIVVVLDSKDLWPDTVQLVERAFSRI